jgi:hypothetical protein
MKIARILIIVLVLGTVLITSSAAQNDVTLGPGYEKGQESQNKLSFVMPQNWSEDKNGATKVGLYCVLVPSGSKLESADKVITIAFQKKDTTKPALDNLKDFFRADLQDTLAKFPDAQFARWQPSKLDPAKVSFMSLEMFGKKKNKPSPQHFVILEAVDGYFSVSLTVTNRDDLKLPLYDEFFNSLAIEPAR